MRVACVGGGVSGSILSIELKRAGFDVSLFEANEIIGKKILSTGNGRCNFTNKNIQIEKYHGENPLFAEKIISKYTYKKITNYFEKMGLYWKSLESGRIYPATFDSRTVRRALDLEIKDLGVYVKLNRKVRSVEKRGGKFFIDGGDLPYDILVLATGGSCRPDLGSDGSGYILAESLGLKKTEILPAIVQIEVERPLNKKIDGVKLNAGLSCFVNGEEIDGSQGDLLIRDYGFSGTAVLDISLSIMENLSEGPQLKVDWIPFLSEEEIFLEFKRLRGIYGDNKATRLVLGLLPEKAGPHILERAGIFRSRKISDLSDQELRDLSHNLKGTFFKVLGEKKGSQGQVSLGGLRTEDFYEDSLECKKVEGLFCLGELLDITGDCGGYNIHWAISSALAAADAIIEKKREYE